MIKIKHLVFLVSLLSAALHHNAYALEWSLTISEHNDYSFSKGYHGCGTLMGKFEEKGISPQDIAEKYCEFWDVYHTCIRDLDHPAHTGGRPSIFYQADTTDSTYYTNYQYLFHCTGSSVSPYTSIVSALVSKGTLNAGDNPKNNGKPLTCEANPINAMNGNKYQNESIYNGLGVGIVGLNMVYNSNYDTEQKLLGDVWRSSYDRTVSADSLEHFGVVSMRRQDGKGFDFQSINDILVPDDDKTYTLAKLTDGQGTITGWQFNNDIGGETELYDVNGKLLSIADRAGLTQTLTYSTAATPAVVAPESGLLIAVTDHVGRSLHFTYDAAKRVTSMTDPAGAIYTYTYSIDNLNLLKTVTFADGSTKTFHYGSEASEAANAPIETNGVNFNTRSLTGITDENNNRLATWVYDTRARAISSEHAGGVDKVSLVYNANGPGGTHPLNTVVTDARGTTRTHSIINTAILGVLKSTGQSQAAGAGCPASASALTYDANGNIASRNDFNGNQTTYVYDMSRNLETSRTEGLSNAGAATAATRTITTTWHPTWRLPLVISEYAGASASGTPLKTTTTDYDDKGNITSVSVNDPFNNISRTVTTAYTYSSAVPGLMLSKVVDGPRTDVNDITTYTYYPHDATCTPSTATPIIDPITNTSPENLGCRGQLQSVTNAANQTTTYDRYNHHGQVEQMTDPNGLVTESTYDLRQRITSRTVGSELTSLQYDAVGQLTQLTMPDGSQLSYTYDAAHRLTDIADNQGNKIHYTLDAQGNRINEDMTDPANQLTKTLSRSYDALNRLQQVVGVE